MSELLRAETISKTWAAAGPAPVRAVRDVSLRVHASEMVVVTGASGSGKTTLLSMLGGLLRPDRGRVLLDGLDLAEMSPATLQQTRLERIGFVFQRGLLVPGLTARDNVALVPRAAGVPRREARARADDLLVRVGLGGRGHVDPSALSAGESQRVAVARALVMRPHVVLADEPTAHLDSASGMQVVQELAGLVRSGGAALVVVTHDARLAALADRSFHLEDGRLD